MVFGFPDPRELRRRAAERAPKGLGRHDGRSRLLPVLQALADGAWLAVAYAAAQAATGRAPIVGPLELALLAGIGMAWARRGRWLDDASDLAGAVILAILGGALTWFLDTDVRIALLAGDTDTAFATHLPGWIGAVAVLRGRTHASRDDDEDQQDRLLRFGIPALAIPWLGGHLAANGPLERAFVASAFISTLLFAASAFTALGLARLELVRRSSGDQPRSQRSWLLLVGGVALGVSLIGVPTAILLGVPVSALTAAVVGPLRVLVLSLLLLTTPLIVAIAALTSLLGPVLPRGFELPIIRLPNLRVDPTEVSSTPTIVFFAVLALLFLAELAAIGLYLWYRMRERRRAEAEELAGFEERSIVRPPEEPATPPPPPRRPRTTDPGTPAGAYIAALEILDRDERLRRAASETPASHLRRVAGVLAGPALARLAAGYQLDRYAGRQLTGRERRRAVSRLARIRQWARR